MDPFYWHYWGSLVGREIVGCLCCHWAAGRDCLWCLGFLIAYSLSHWTLRRRSLMEKGRSGACHCYQRFLFFMLSAVLVALVFIRRSMFYMVWETPISLVCSRGYD